MIFSLGPVFKNHIHGGSQKILREVAIYLGKLGHEVNIFCNRRKDNEDDFELSKNVNVYPKLLFKETYPSAYKTNPFNLYKTIEILDKQIDNHDIFYVHDAQINFPFLHNKNIPTIISARDYIYPETLIGCFNFRRDKIIVNSFFTRDNVKYTLGKFMPEINDRVETILNGFDLNDLKKKDSNELKKKLNLNLSDNDKIILFPNRPEPAKGIFENLEIVSRLVNKNNLKNLKLLIPRYIDLNVCSELEILYNEIKKVAKEKGIINNIVFHDWIEYKDRAKYFSMGDLTLSIGNFVEGFGSNSSIESICCGTPSIVSKVGAQRTTVPEEIIPKFAYGDYDGIERKAFDILMNPDVHYDYDKVRKYVEETFDMNKMLKSYADVILNCEVTSPIEVSYEDKKIEGNYVVSPWCCMTKFGIYCDYDYSYTKVSEKLKKILSNNFQINCSEESLDEVKSLINKGILVKK